MSTQTETKTKLAWGLTPEQPAKAAWGARAIYQDTDVYIDLLHDRQDGFGSKPDLAILLKWVNETSMPKLRDIVRDTYLASSSKDVVRINGNGYRLIASPRCSYGYLYIGAWIIDYPKALTKLQDQSESLWSMCAETAGIVDCGDGFDPEREKDANEDRRKCHRLWQLAIGHAKKARTAEVMHALQNAAELARKWGDDTPEQQAIELYEAGE